MISGLINDYRLLHKSRRFGGPIGTLALSVNENRQADALAILQTAGLGAGNGTLHWDERASAASLLELAVGSRAHANDGYGSFFSALAAKPRDEAGQAAWVRRVLLAFDGFRILCASGKAPGAWPASTRLSSSMALTSGHDPNRSTQNPLMKDRFANSGRSL